MGKFKNQHWFTKANMLTTQSKTVNKLKTQQK